MAAFETQGRFIKSRYGDDGPEALQHKDGTEQSSIAD
jgi:hypothetical protein